MYLPLAEAQQVAEKLRHIIEHHAFTEDLHITVSLGVAEYHTGEIAEKWISRADFALYQAKKAGRNTVMAASAKLDN